jgi:hypothetical protein
MLRPTFATWTKIRDACASLAALLIVIPIALSAGGYWSSDQWWIYLANVMLVLVGVTLIFLLPEIDDRRTNARYRALDDRNERWQRMYVGPFVLTPHRLEILEKKGVSKDVIDDLKPLVAKFGLRNVDASQFFPEIENVLGPARFADERETIRFVHDATRTLAELEKPADD